MRSSPSEGPEQSEEGVTKLGYGPGTGALRVPARTSYQVPVVPMRDSCRRRGMRLEQAGNREEQTGRPARLCL
jgi:hypothetical protein